MFYVPIDLKTPFLTIIADRPEKPLLIYIIFTYFSGVIIFIAIVIESPPAAFGSFLAFTVSYHLILLLLEVGNLTDQGIVTEQRLRIN